ncbi:hypothetical protein N8291_09035, partial [Pseudomonadales bacterium]|nr:hypothetical protein [Pseudomonadales bacterium]
EADGIKDKARAKQNRAFKIRVILTSGYGIDLPIAGSRTEHSRVSARLLNFIVQQMNYKKNLFETPHLQAI